ncbi:MAG: protein fwdD [Anaerolineae bacterium]|nr:protein fwdD [Anaerolineae bacterium]
MADNTFTLITGRSGAQGTGISWGKEGEGYREAVQLVELNPADMECLGLQEGDAVRLISRYGATEALCRPGNLPTGLAFMAFGPVANQLTGAETRASGMPDTRGFEVRLEPVLNRRGVDKR